MTSLAVVNSVAFVLVLLALALSVRRPIHGTEEGRAVIVLLGVLVLLSTVGLIRRVGHSIVDGAALTARPRRRWAGCRGTTSLPGGTAGPRHPADSVW